MGKRAKLFKTGNNKAYNTVMKARRKNKLAKVLPHLKEKETSTREIKTSDSNQIIDEKPKLRHRRIKDRSVLSRGQKRRKIKKLREEIRKNIPNKVKDQTPVTQKANEKPSFNLKDIDNTLMDVFEEKDTQKKSKKTAKLSKKELIQNEKEKIFKAMDNKNFNNNPFETIKTHIAKDQYIKEKNKLMAEHLHKMDDRIKGFKK